MMCRVRGSSGERVMKQTIKYPALLEPFRELGASFARRELLENRQSHDRYPFSPFWDEVLQRAADAGFFGTSLSEEKGGSGSGPAALASLCGELARVDASLAGIVFTAAAAIEIINGAAGERDSSDVLKLIAEGDPPLAAFQSFTRPGEAELPHTVREGTSTRLRGEARNLVMGEIARRALMAAEDDEGSFSYFLLDLEDNALSRSDTVHAIGFRACPMIDVSLKGAAALPVGDPGSGPALYRRMERVMAPAASAILLGVMKGSFEEARDYAMERRQGGRLIIDWPQISMMLGGMAIEIDIAEDSLAQCLSCMLEGREYDARPLAILLGEQACRLTTDGVQILGGNGYMSDYGQEKRMRDARMARQLLGMSALRRLGCLNEATGK